MSGIEIEALKRLLDGLLEFLKAAGMRGCEDVAEGRAQRLTKGTDDFIVPAVVVFTDCSECVRFALDFLAPCDNLPIFCQYPIMDLLELGPGQLVRDAVVFDLEPLTDIRSEGFQLEPVPIEVMAAVRSRVEQRALSNIESEFTPFFGGSFLRFLTDNNRFAFLVFTHRVGDNFLQSVNSLR